jgi:HTH-type transcriptional regulator/antitoxin HigA
MRTRNQIKHDFSAGCHGRRYCRLVKLLDGLIDEVGEDENHPPTSFMERIGMLIKKYKDEKVPVLT